jgi:hypothetical protein
LIKRNNERKIISRCKDKCHVSCVKCQNSSLNCQLSNAICQDIPRFSIPKFHEAGQKVIEEHRIIVVTLWSSVSSLCISV